MVPHHIVVEDVQEYRSISSEFSAVIDRILTKTTVDGDGDILLNGLERIVPPNTIIYPHEAEMHVSSGGTITCVVQVLPFADGDV